MEASGYTEDVGGICTINGLVDLEGSGTGRVREKPNSRTSCLAWKLGVGDRSSNDRLVGGSVVGRPGGSFGESLLAEIGFAGGFSGLLGGVLKGETWSSDDAKSDLGANVLVSGWENWAGLAGIFGFDALLAGGGSEALLSFRSAGLPFAPTVRELGDSRWAVFPTGTDDPSCGVIGLGGGGAGETPAETDALGR